MKLILTNHLDVELLHFDMYKGTNKSLDMMSKWNIKKYDMIYHNNTNFTSLYGWVAKLYSIIISFVFVNKYYN